MVPNWVMKKTAATFANDYFSTAAEREEGELFQLPQIVFSTMEATKVLKLDV